MKVTSIENSLRCIKEYHGVMRYTYAHVLSNNYCMTRLPSLEWTICVRLLKIVILCLVICIKVLNAYGERLQQS